MRRRRVFRAILPFLVCGLVLAAAWSLFDWPPVSLCLKYGPSPGCAPTGRTIRLEGVEFVEIGPGCFRMGSERHGEPADPFWGIGRVVGLDLGEGPGTSSEMPVHWVEFEQGFWIARTEITNEQFELFSEMGRSDRREVSPGNRSPVVDITFREARDYCEWLAKRTGLPIRLPSEAEWECACRAGTTTEYSFGDDEALLPEHAWCDANAEGRAHEVRKRRPNDWDLFDFHGNAWEWVEDTYHGSYEGAPVDGSPWTKGGRKPAWAGSYQRVLRGGGWTNEADDCRAASRYSELPTLRSGSVGFRPAISGGAVPE